MKPVLMFALLVGIAPSAFSQYIVRVHAFSQEIIPGVAPSVSEGEAINPQRRFDHQVFIECKSSVTLKLRSVRINETIHSAHLQAVESPVVQFHPTTLRSDTLVRKTPHKLLKVVLDKELGSSTRDTVGVAISYSVRGKKYVHRTKQFKELPAIALP